MNIKCYFAHPYSHKGTSDEKRIIEILKYRRVEVINPFDGEEDYIKEHFNMKSYYPLRKYKVGRWIWVKCMQQLHKCNMALFWIPEDEKIPENIGHFRTTAKGCYAELQEAVSLQNKILKSNKFRGKDDQQAFLIQLITKDRHPIIAWALCNGNQLYDNIDDFERFRQTRWD